MSIQVKTYTGKDVEKLIPILAPMRIAIFQDFPYLYDGTLAYEEEYLKYYAVAKCAALVVALDQGVPVGAATCIALSEAFPEIIAPFESKNLPIHQFCYFGESVLMTEYRGRGIGHLFFEHREAFAKQFDEFTDCVFCAVVRPEDHPLRPDDYKDLSEFWKKRGYSLDEGLTTHMHWKDEDEAEESPKLMQFWRKKIR